jgi:alkylated DNA repair protein (DNA oxidative demethylase)
MPRPQREAPDAAAAASEIANGFLVLRRFFDRAAQHQLVEACHAVARLAPFITPTMPDGRPFRVEMTNAGVWGWLSDGAGYRYARCHPVTGAPWPAPPPVLAAAVERAVAAALGAPAAAAFRPECYLINRYAPGRGRLGLHRDQDERDRAQPIVTLSLGAAAVFLAGGGARKDRIERVAVESGDVVVMSGATRMAYHGIDRLLPTVSPVTGDGSRLSVTVRRVDADES